MSVPFRCPDLNDADPDGRLPASDEEQVLMVVEVGLVAAMMDDQMPQEKVDALVAAIRLLPGLRELGDVEVNMLLSRTGHRAQEGDAWLCDIANRLENTALRRVAFRMASMFCAWDGVIDDREQGYLNFLSDAFGFDEQQAHSLFAEATGKQGKVTTIVPPPLDSDASDPS